MATASSSPIDCPPSPSCDELDGDMPPSSPVTYIYLAVGRAEVGSPRHGATIRFDVPGDGAITPNGHVRTREVLSESLEDLEEKGIVDREIVNEKPVRVEYSLTEFGESLEPVIFAMRDWGMEYLEEPAEDSEA